MDGRPVDREATANVHQALQEISNAADGRLTKSSNSNANHRAIRTALNQSWFGRIWVLQEVAAARHVIIMCHSMDIDGYAFCAGLNVMNITLEDLETQSRIRSAAYLIKRAGLRPKHLAGLLNQSSLDIRPLGELVDMYHSSKAKDSRDKIYALLAMSSDPPVSLSPNYNILWKDLFRRLVHSLIGEQASVETWDKKEVAVIKSKGYVLGEVLSVYSAGAWDDKQNVVVNIHLKNESKSLWKWHGCWTLQVFAKPILQGDIVCLLQGASKPTIIRPCKDYSAIIAISITPRDDDRPEGELFDWQYCSRRIRTFPNELLLVWDWERSRESLECDNDYQRFLNSRIHGHLQTGMEDHLGKATRLHNIGLLLRDAERYEEAIGKFQEVIKVYESAHGRVPPQLLTVDITENGSLQGKAEKLRIIADVLGRRGDYFMITEYGMIQVARSFDQVLMKILLDQHRGQIIVTKDTVKAAAFNRASGMEVMRLLLEWRQYQITITEEAAQTIAGQFNKHVVKLMLSWCAEKVIVTKEVLKAAVGNELNGKEVVELLLDRRGDQVVVTDDVVKAAAQNRKSGKAVMELLLDRRGDQVVVTEDVVKAAAKNRKSGKAVMELLLSRRGDQVIITEDVVATASYNWESGKAVIKLLLDREGDQVIITNKVAQIIARRFDREIVGLLLDRHGEQIVFTEEVVQTIAGRFDRHLMGLLLDRYGDQVIITENVVKSAAQNLWCGKEVIELILDRRGDQVIITENVISLAAQNQGCGQGILALLQTHSGKQEQTLRFL